MNAFLILLLVFVAVLIGGSWWLGRNETEEDFLIAGRQRSWWQIAASKYAASIGAGWMITYTGFAYEYGWPLITIIIGGLVGIYLFVKYAIKRIYIPETAAAYSLSDYVRHATSGRIAQQCVDATVIIMSVLALLIAVTGAAHLFEVSGVLTYELAVAVTVGTVLAYVWFAGYRAVMLTDVVQGVLLFGLLLLLAGAALFVSTPTSETIMVARNISPLGIGILAIFGLVSVFADPTRYQVAFAGKHAQAVSRGMYATVVPLILTALAIFLLAAAVFQTNSMLATGAVFPYALNEFLPAWVVPFGFLAFITALMSTCDSYIYALVTHTTSLFGKTQTKARARWSLVFYSVLLVGISFIFRDVVDIAVLLGAIMLVLALPVMYLIFGGVSATRFVLLLAGGYIGAFLGVLFIGLEPDAGAFVIVGYVVGWLVPTRLVYKLA